MCCFFFLSCVGRFHVVCMYRKRSVATSSGVWHFGYNARDSPVCNSRPPFSIYLSFFLPVFLPPLSLLPPFPAFLSLSLVSPLLYLSFLSYLSISPFLFFLYPYTPHTHTSRLSLELAAAAWRQHEEGGGRSEWQRCHIWKNRAECGARERPTAPPQRTETRDCARRAGTENETKHFR